MVRPLPTSGERGYTLAMEEVVSETSTSPVETQSHTITSASSTESSVFSSSAIHLSRTRHHPLAASHRTRIETYTKTVTEYIPKPTTVTVTKTVLPSTADFVSFSNDTSTTAQLPPTLIKSASSSAKNSTFVWPTVPVKASSVPYSWIKPSWTQASSTKAFLTKTTSAIFTPIKPAPSEHASTSARPTRVIWGPPPKPATFATWPYALVEPAFDSSETYTTAEAKAIQTTRARPTVTRWV